MPGLAPTLQVKPHGHTHSHNLETMVCVCVCETIRRLLSNSIIFTGDHGSVSGRVKLIRHLRLLMGHMVQRPSPEDHHQTSQTALDRNRSKRIDIQLFLTSGLAIRWRFSVELKTYSKSKGTQSTTSTKTFDNEYKRVLTQQCQPLVKSHGRKRL